MTNPPAVLSAFAAGVDSRLQTRAAVLDAAERLISEFGVDGVSVRDITTAAKANLGAVNYHFGSKDRLVLEVFARRLEPVIRARVARLDALEKAAGGGEIELSQIVEAFVRPGVENATSPQCAGEPFMRLISRCFMEPNPELKRFVEERFADVVTRFDAAFLRALPGLTQEDLFWRVNFLIGALHHGQEIWARFDQLPRLGANVTMVQLDREEFIRRVIVFVTAGLRAGLPASAPAPAQLPVR